MSSNSQLHRITEAPHGANLTSQWLGLNSSLLQSQQFCHWKVPISILFSGHHYNLAQISPPASPLRLFFQRLLIFLPFLLSLWCTSNLCLLHTQHYYEISIPKILYHPFHKFLQTAEIQSLSVDRLKHSTTSYGIWDKEYSKLSACHSRPAIHDPSPLQPYFLPSTSQ